jgi:hypothetical protein
MRSKANQASSASCQRNTSRKLLVIAPENLLPKSIVRLIYQLVKQQPPSLTPPKGLPRAAFTRPSLSPKGRILLGFLATTTAKSATHTSGEIRRLAASVDSNARESRDGRASSAHAASGTHVSVFVCSLWEYPALE